VIPISELLSMLANGTAPAPIGPPRCGRCDREVRRIGHLCPGCEHLDRRSLREAALRTARESIPPAFRNLDAQEVRRRTTVDQESLELALTSTARSRVVLVGASGFGKTTLACLMLRQVIEVGVDGARAGFERARRALFVDAPGLCRAVRDHPLGAGDAPMLERALRASVLVLDDVGQELELRMPCNPVVEVIRERHAQERATWVTTFLSPAGMEKGYGSGTARRVLDGAAVISVGP
jgi:DNA replication protein DnaC